MPEIATFRVYPGFRNREHNTGIRGLYFVVRVYTTLAEMRKCCAEDGTSPANFFQGAYGACQKWQIKSVKPKRGKRKGRPARTKEAGQIMLARRHLGVAIVSHECAHAACYWFSRIKCKSERAWVKDVTKVEDVIQEEMLCYAVGELSRQVYLGLEEAGVLKLTRG